jgi:S1-C subfamily serine protease
MRFGLCAAAAATAAALTLTGCTGTPEPAPGSSIASPRASQAQLADGAGLPAVPGVVREVEPSVVTIRTAIGLGSGVIYHSDGSIVTDAHVVEDEQKQPFENVEVQFADGSQSQGAVIGVDDVTDLAVLKVDRTGLPAAKFAASDPEVGTMTVVIGSPLGLEETVTAGIVSSLHRNMPPSKESPHGAIDLLQTDAPISPGNSGGAVADSSGQVIGLSEAYLPPSTGAVAIGFVTPSSTVTDVADQLLASGSVKHAALGVVPTDITPQLAQRFSLPTRAGALIVIVSQGSPAEQAGMKAGDIITKFAQTDIGNVTDLLAALRKQDPGQQVDLVVQRGATSQDLHITLGNLAGEP